VFTDVQTSLDVGMGREIEYVATRHIPSCRSTLTLSVC